MTTTAIWLPTPNTRYMAARNAGYPGVRIASGTYVGLLGALVNCPVVASAAPSCWYPLWSDHEIPIPQSGRWRTMYAAACSSATTLTISRLFLGIVQQITIERCDIAQQTLEVVTVDHRRSRALAGGTAALAIREIAHQRGGETGRVAIGHARADRIGVDHVLDAAHISADAGDSGGHRFDQRDRSAFVARGQQEHI